MRRRPSLELPKSRLLAISGALLLAALAALIGMATGCGRASPTAPSGSTLVLTVSPTSIVSSSGSAIATATLRLPDGTPQPGAQVQFSATLGTLNPAMVATDNNGVATSRLTGDGRIGMSTVQAFSGAVMSSQVMVNIGTAAASITLQANPSTIGANGGVVQLIALVRDASGNPVPGSAVNFSTQAGTLASGGGFVFTDSTGTARDTLKVTSIDLNNQTGSSFNVSVQGSTSGGTATTFAINIARPPVANFTATTVTGSLSVAFTDTSTNHPTSWHWDFGDPASGGADTSTEENPAHVFSGPGAFVVTLTAVNAVGSGTETQVISVTGPSGG